MSKSSANNSRIHPVIWMFFGAIAIVVLAAAAGYVALTTGAVPANADVQPSAFEFWAARTSLHATVDRQAAGLVDPLSADESTLSAGMKLYGSNCMVCHGASDGKPSDIARGLYQHAPQLGFHGVEDDPEGETFWKVDHGIRLTGMPSFGHTLTETQIWQLATFLKHMDSLPPKLAIAWKKMPSQFDPHAPPLMFGPGPPGSHGPPR
jgi:thiosulfate dehydrogenase